MSVVPSPHLGRHVVADVSECFSPLLDDAAALEQLLRSAAVAAGATVLSGHHHTFEPHGATALCVLAESHISIHTWPELGAATLDAYTCGDQADPVVAIDYILRELHPGHVEQALLSRGGGILESAPAPWRATVGA
jgi:S-adenosylmethionine decarboxylase proenzyme